MSMDTIIIILSLTVVIFSYIFLFFQNNLSAFALPSTALSNHLVFTIIEVSIFILCFNLLKKSIIKDFFDENRKKSIIKDIFDENRNEIQEEFRNAVKVLAPNQVLLKEFFNENRNEIQEEFRNAVKVLAPNQILLSDITGVFQSREDANVRDFLTKSQKEIDIFTPNLRYFTMDNRGRIFEEAIRKGCRIRLLALHPKNVFTSERFQQIDLRNARSFALEMYTSIEKFMNDYVKVNQGQVELRVFDEPPTNLIMRSDDKVLVGFILRQARSREYLHLCMSCNTNRLGEPFAIHFDTTFDNARTVRDDESLRKIQREISDRYDNLQ